MVSSVLPFWGVAFLLTASCWGVGLKLVSAQRPIVAMLAGWCGFLALCALPWIVGVPASWASPLFWIFTAAGLGFAIRGRQWTELSFAAIGTGVLTAIIGYPFIRFPGLLAYGAHGLDMWGYVMTADWLQAHSIRHFPEIGVDPIRFNWTWHVLITKERPLIYESLACLGSASGLGPARAYVVYPIALLASLAVALAREPRVFRLKSGWLALVPALVIVFHPLLILTWIAGFFAGSITSMFAAFAFAGAVAGGSASERDEALAWSVLMFVFCGALYTEKFLLVGLVAGGAPLAVAVIMAALRHDFAPLFAARPGRRMTMLVTLIVVFSVALLLLGEDQFANIGEPQLPIAAAGHLLGIFGGTSPYVWIGFGTGTAFDRNPIYNPVGCSALVLMLMLFGLVAWSRWKTNRDIRLPVFVGLCSGMIWLSAWDELIMAKTLVLFGFALIVLLATVSTDLQHVILGVAALAVCCLPGLRSANEMRDLLYGPFITCTEENVANISDGQDWRVLSYLHFREDQQDLVWKKFPRSYGSITHFLPLEARQRLAKKHEMPEPK